MSQPTTKATPVSENPQTHQHNAEFNAELCAVVYNICEAITLKLILDIMKKRNIQFLRTNDDKIKHDVNLVSKCVAAKRICSKDGKRFRAIKISFSDHESLETALKNKSNINIKRSFSE